MIETSWICTPSPGRQQSVNLLCVLSGYLTVIRKRDEVEPGRYGKTITVRKDRLRVGITSDRGLNPTMRAGLRLSEAPR